MCTVTFIPLNNKVFITHNRDEQSIRAKAAAPAIANIHGYPLLFPRDGAAGGSWIGINKNGNAAVLLNGAFIKHTVEPPYRKSRGLVFLDILATNDLLLAYHQLDLNGIEPFTVILWSNRLLYECRWDGNQKYIYKRDATVPHTWSSVTLYDDATLRKRQQWFDAWQQQHTAPAMEDIIQYHLSGGDGDAHNDLRMNRHGQLLTVSITAMELDEDVSTMHYLSLQDNTRAVQQFGFTKAAAIQ